MVKEKYSLSVTWDKTIKSTAKPENSSSRLLHRYLLKPSKGLTVDHINRNPLDNRKENLRRCTCRENNLNKRNNTSGCPGVRWHSQGKKWNARITIKGKEKSLGMFNTFEEAVKARYEALKEVI